MTTLHLGNSINRPPLRLAFLLTLALCWLALSAQAVTPAPDGGYPGANTAEGTNALFNLTTGVWNSAVGFRALYKNAAGIRNTAVGYQTLYNTNALSSNHYIGIDNVGVGANALFNNTTGSRNIAIGTFALYDNTTGSDNIAIGNLSLRSFNGNGNTVVGDSFASNPDNVSVGRLPIYVHGGIQEPGVLTANVNAQNDIYIGSVVLIEPFYTYTSRVHIQAQDAVYMGAVFGNPIAGSPVNIDSNGQLGVAPSSERFKDGIKPMDKASEALLSLRPVTFHYKKTIDPKGAPQFGLVAEDVEKVNPDLVVRDAEGKAFTVRYEAVNAMLLNEFLKEHRTVQELKSTAAKQEATIAKQRKQIEALTAGLQRVSAQVEKSRPAPQMVLNNQ
jgi:hypothetical protein